MLGNKNPGQPEKNKPGPYFDYKQWWATIGSEWFERQAVRLRHIRLDRALKYGAATALCAWLATGFYIVNAGERGVVTRFLAYRETAEPGPHWHWPAPIEQVHKINVERQRFLEVGYRSGSGRQVPVPSEARMLTGDENIVDLHLAVQYRIENPADYLFNIQAPEDILKQLTESVTRSVVGQQNMDYVLTEGRSEIVARIEKELQRILDEHRSGIRIAGVNLQDVQPPEEVQQAFEDAIKAREDRERLINEAQAYANEIVPKARGEAARLIAEAEAHLQTVTARAKGEADRFRRVLAEYRKHPDITRRRLAIETMEEILTRTDSVVVDLEGSGNVVYLPLNPGQSGPIRGNEPATAGAKPQASTAERPIRNTLRRGRSIRGE
ncbi:modulator of FtsH protease HflK [Methylomarinovum caldicuralii]|uniref:Protein HflK n=1 Tax=Methylomarinovum caldicuralii TaxID=438856 RepID=A0AAU9CWX4_9GAMM|nr:FtsH protease activity modulator HflK [Methylomarinovum caldicuralii]BCX82477.1 modulator of FtsH protease HflK [Methylomarinovum caldicuralii]